MKLNIEAKTRKLELLRAQKKLKDELPHLYGQKEYWWSRKFRESKHKLSFLFAPNQAGKSASGIKKCIDICTNPKWWGVVSSRPKPVFGFYLYPDKIVARREIETKWIVEFLPRGEKKDDPQFGWTPTDNKDELSITFNSGVKVYFIGYSQGKGNLLAMAAASPDFVFIDEELPPNLWPELSMRVEAVDGLINFLATPVECYKFWKDVQDRKNLANAEVLTFSLYDCLKFEDGSPGMYTIEKIESRKAKLGTDAEIQKRVFGKFVAPEGMLFPSFNREVNYVPGEKVPENWIYFAGVDYGSGGATGHPGSISIVAVSPDFKRGRLVRGWIGNNVETTTAEDILNKYIELSHGLPVVRMFYDWAAADFGEIARRNGFPFENADKSRDSGIALMNTLFKNGALTIDACDEHERFADQLESLRANQDKKHAEDDGPDSLRYAITKIPWVVEVRQIKTDQVVKKEEQKSLRERGHRDESLVEADEVQEWADFMEDI